MKVALVDVDNVLNNGRNTDELRLARSRVSTLNSLCRLSGAAVVVFGNWCSSKEGRDNMKQALEDAGFKGKFLGCIPQAGFREKALGSWLKQRQDVESYVILDGLDKYTEKCILVKGGLKKHHVTAALEILEG